MSPPGHSCRPLATRTFISLLLIATWTASAGEPFVPTPAQLYGPLFARVQMAGLRPGDDNFVDDVPKAPPAVIMQRYRQANPRSREALLRFVEGNFTFPARVSTPPIPTDRTVAGSGGRTG